MIRHFLPLLFLFSTQFMGPGLQAVSQETRPVISVSELNAPTEKIKKPSSQEPFVIRSKEAAIKLFGQKQVDGIKAKVDFDKQVLMVFCWSGSGQDRIEVSVLESFPEQVKFKLVPGRTRDLRAHTAAFAVRKDVIWRGKPVGKQIENSGTIRVDVIGKLDSQVMAIGAETTGFQITAKGITWELDFGPKEELKELARKLHGSSIRIKGSLSFKKGVEIKRRWIVTVDSLTASEKK